MASPSSRRREGRKSYMPGCDPEAECPYRSDDYSRRDWLEGWEQASLEDAAEQDELVEKQLAWSNLSCSCPWYDGDGRCEAIPGNACHEGNCAPLYFINNAGE